MSQISVDLMQPSSSPSLQSSSEGHDDAASVETFSPSPSPDQCRRCGFRMLPKSPRSKPHPPKRKKPEAGLSSQPSCKQSSQKTAKRSSEEQVGQICNCIAAFSGDCAAICCCPLILLHVLALLIFKLPAAIAIKITARLQNKLRTKPNCSISSESACTPHTLASPWPEYLREKMDESPASMKFQDEEFLREYFECKQLGFGGVS